MLSFCSIKYLISDIIVILGQKVAVKVLESIHEMIEEIEQEFIILSDHGDHPNMPKFYGLFLKPGMDNQIWIVMEVYIFLLEF
jgi:serine/threonine protein kinase